MFLQTTEKHTKWRSAICNVDRTALADKSHRNLTDPRTLILPAISFIVASSQTGPTALLAALIPPLLCGKPEEICAVPQLVHFVSLDQAGPLGHFGPLGSARDLPMLRTLTATLVLGHCCPWSFQLAAEVAGTCGLEGQVGDLLLSLTTWFTTAFSLDTGSFPGILACT